MSAHRQDAVAGTLAQGEIHERWERVYRTDANEQVYEAMFDRLIAHLPPPGSHVLDAGCGVGAHTSRLARRGYRVTAIDFSPHVVPQAQERMREEGLADRVEIRQDDLTRLSFGDASFDAVVAWGVLMHVPDVAAALDEITRVTRPGGRLVVSEVNARAPEAIVTRNLLTRLSSRDIRARRTAAGVEHDERTESGTYLWRHADIGWLEEQLQVRGWRTPQRLPGHFTELYQRASERASRALHALNRTWTLQDRLTWPGKGTIVVAQRG
jgi:ubiquinone/menaquinone biosynthesis C-methylase UbiE